ncbi:GNAT family N-acetyltransferase [Silvimonas amylolytica]|uniref:N-acetyltransferase n=1 Tax=Silvimonas amylolytica TaxID=449663 RepID=A0ABQ2PL50_9NEIS|nr:GNAT family N-acetyltransferase [Silvimonas amylolytica]GGP26337.1 N-acetyltransferase [Silvimonas amylolytica]
MQMRRRDRHAEGDEAALQAVFDAAPTYSLLVEGQLPQPDAARQALDALPPGVGYDDKFVQLLIDGSEVIGAVDLIRGYPDRHCAWLGLLLLVENRQRQGWGAKAFEQVLHTAHRWQCTEMRLGVVACNTVALCFWQALGFVEIERRDVDGYTDEVIVMRRAL